MNLIIKSSTGNYYILETHVSRCCVKDEEEKVDTEFNKPNTNTEQFHGLDKEREAGKYANKWVKIIYIILH